MELFTLVFLILITIGLYGIYKSIYKILDVLGKYYLLAFSEETIDWVWKKYITWRNVHETVCKKENELYRKEGKEAVKKKEKEFTPSRKYRESVFEEFLSLKIADGYYSDYYLLIEANLRAKNGENTEKIRNGTIEKSKFYGEALGEEIENLAIGEYLDWEKQYPGEKLDNGEQFHNLHWIAARFFLDYSHYY